MRPVPAAPLVVALLVTAATVAGAIVLALDPAPFSPSSALLLAAGMALATVPAVTWGFAAWSLLLALLLARTVPGALLMVRWVHPVAAAATAITAGLPSA